MHPPSTSSLLLSLLAWSASSLAYDCKSIVIDKRKYDLRDLGGPRSVVTTYESMPGKHINTTYTIDICKPLKKGDKGESCPNGTWICAISRYLAKGIDDVQTVRAIAGTLQNVGGGQFEPEVSRIKNSDSNSDVEKEGIRLVLTGGKHPLDGPSSERRPQKAIIEFMCDPEKKGTEGEWETEEKYEKYDLDRRDDDKDDKEQPGESGVEHQLKNNDTALIWQSYKEEEKADVLRMTWHTKLACEKRDDKGDDKDGDKGGDKDGDKDDGGNEDASSNWGFFTWFVIIVFLGIASYLIFGSWLNYNRYGARGWDLLPHGDTIRDVPYLMKDWTRRVLNTVQGAGSRGGYSAV